MYVRSLGIAWHGRASSLAASLVHNQRSSRTLAAVQPGGGDGRRFGLVGGWGSAIRPPSQSRSSASSSARSRCAVASHAPPGWPTVRRPRRVGSWATAGLAERIPLCATHPPGGADHDGGRDGGHLLALRCGGARRRRAAGRLLLHCREQAPGWTPDKVGNLVLKVEDAAQLRASVPGAARSGGSHLSGGGGGRWSSGSTRATIRRTRRACCYVLLLRPRDADLYLTGLRPLIVVRSWSPSEQGVP